MDKPIRIEQALYGYQDGHRLLFASAEIPPGAERLILPLSDGPDLPVPVPPEGYISGYPVAAIESFALSMTWPAPEMPRPGCVWTHVLLISFQDLATVAAPSGLWPNFQRPQGPVPEGFRYTKPLELPKRSQRVDPPRGSLPATTAGLLRLVYGASQPIVIRCEDRATAQHQVLALWDQQWPELRRGFSFTTVATTREVGGGSFDLRLIFEHDPVLQRALGGEVHAISEVTDSDLSWIAATFEDLRKPGPLRKALWRYGDEAGARRRAFAPLVELYSLQSSVPCDSDGAGTLLRAVGNAFSEPEDMRSLKKDLFGPQVRDPAPGQLNWRGSEETLLTALILAPEVEALAGEDLELRSRLVTLWREDQDAALRLLQLAAEVPGRPLSRAALNALLPLADGEPELVVKAAPAAVPLAIDRNPTFATHSVVWKGPEEEIAKRWSALETIPFLGRARKEIVRALLIADKPSAVQLAFNRWGAGVVGDLLEIAGERGAPGLGRGWLELLRSHPDEVAQWFASQGKPPVLAQLALVAETADPEQIAGMRRPLGPWIELLDRSKAGDWSPLSGRQLAFFFQLGLASNEPSAAPLLLRSIQALNEGGAHSGLRRELEARLGRSAGVGNGTDRQLDALAVALADKWRQEGWALPSLVEGTNDSRLASEILRAYLRSKKGTKTVERYLESMPKKRSAKLREMLPELRDQAKKSKRTNK